MQDLSKYKWFSLHLCAKQLSDTKVLSLTAARYYVHLALIDHNIQRFDVFRAACLAHHVVNKFIDGMVLILCWQLRVLQPTIEFLLASVSKSLPSVLFKQFVCHCPCSKILYTQRVSWALTSTPTCTKKNTGHECNVSLWLPAVKVIWECTPPCTQRRHQIGTRTNRPVPRACRWRDFLPKFIQPHQ